MRLSAGMAMVVQGVLALLAGPPLGAVLIQALSIGLGLFLLAGLWTPVAGTLSSHTLKWVFLDPNDAHSRLNRGH